MPDIYDNFQKGDLLFGIDRVRCATNGIKEKLERMHAWASEVCLVPDGYNNLILDRIFQNGLFDEDTRAVLENFLQNPTQTELRKQLGISDIQCDWELVRHHYQCIKSNPKVGFLNEDFESDDEELDLDKIRKIRACQARLADPDITIHFVLDGVDPRHIFVEDYKDATGSHYGSYTSAELRFILENYETLKNLTPTEYKESTTSVTPRKHLQFYTFSEGYYKECDFFQWLSMQCQAAKDAAVAWAHESNIDISTKRKIEIAAGSPLPAMPFTKPIRDEKRVNKPQSIGFFGAFVNKSKGASSASLGSPATPFSPGTPGSDAASPLMPVPLPSKPELKSKSTFTPDSNISSPPSQMRVFSPLPTNAGAGKVILPPPMVLPSAANLTSL
jgi:hypothetical protein